PIKILPPKLASVSILSTPDAPPPPLIPLKEDVVGGKMILVGERDEDLTNLDWLHAGRDLLGSLRLGGQAGLRAVSPPPDSLPSPAPSDTACDGDGSSLVRNPNGKPPYSFSCLIFLAIEASLYKRLPVKGIYDWILEHFPYFVSAPSGWKNSVRHNLSLNKCFKKVIKDRYQNLGRGSLWCVDPGYRPNLIQALNKTPFHPYSHVLNTPPASPDSTQLDMLTCSLQFYRDGTKRQHVRHDSECSCGSPLVSSDPNEDHNYGMSDQGQDVQAGGFQSLVSGSSSCSSHSSHTSQSMSSTSSPLDEPFDLSLKRNQQVENTRAECYTGKSQDDKGRAPTAKGNVARKITTMDDEELKAAAGYLLHLAGVKECLETVVSRSQARPSSEKRRRRK
uniref:Fork-head domain-containing protein n=1 Tax=Eptatretus burgeri TaxID=7764 RepID=A0A8C4QJ83_EPTBU